MAAQNQRFQQHKTEVAAHAQMKDKVHAQETALKQQIVGLKRKLQREVEEKARLKGQKIHLESELNEERSKLQRHMDAAHVEWEKEQQRSTKILENEAKHSIRKFELALAAANKKCSDAVASLKQATAEKTTTEESLQEELQRARAQAVDAGAKSAKELRSLQTNNGQLLDKLATSQAQLKDANIRLEQAQAQIDRLTTENSHRSQEGTSNSSVLDGASAELKSKLVEAQMQASVIQNRYDILQQEATRYKRQYADVSKEVSDLQQKAVSTLQVQQLELARLEKKHLKQVDTLVKKHRDVLEQIRVCEEANVQENIEKAIAEREQHHQEIIEDMHGKHRYQLQVLQRTMDESMQSKDKAIARLKVDIQNLKEIENTRNKREEDERKEWDAARAAYIEVQESLQRRLIDFQTR